MKVKWYGNQGRLTPDPGTVESAQCDVCRESMTVERDVLGATSSAEAMGGHKHLHDVFRCPNYREAWHERAVQLIGQATETVSTHQQGMLADEITEIIVTRKVPE